MQDVTKAELTDLKSALSLVPKKARNEAWEKTFRFVQGLLSSGNNLAIRTFADELHYSVKCLNCGHLIKVGDEFASRIEGYSHLDCWMSEHDGEIKLK